MRLRLAIVIVDVAVAGDGRVTADPAGRGDAVYAPITSVTPRGDWLYLGSLEEHAIDRIPRPGST